MQKKSNHNKNKTKSGMTRRWIGTTIVRLAGVVPDLRQHQRRSPSGVPRAWFTLFNLGGGGGDGEVGGGGGGDGGRGEGFVPPAAIVWYPHKLLIQVNTQKIWLSLDFGIK